MGKNLLRLLAKDPASFSSAGGASQARLVSHRALRGTENFFITVEKDGNENLPVTWR